MNTPKNLQMSSVVTLDRMSGDSPEDTALLKQMAREADGYMRSFKWCADAKDQYYGLGVGGVVAVFLFRILPSDPSVDEWLWVIAGDLPPAYLVTDDSPTPTAALRAYISEMRKWVLAVEGRKPVDNLIPVNAPPTQEWARELDERLELLESEILPMFERAS